MKINFNLRLKSTQKSPVKITYDDQTSSLIDGEVLEVEKQIAITPDSSRKPPKPTALKEPPTSTLPTESASIPPTPS